MARGKHSRRAANRRSAQHQPRVEQLRAEIVGQPLRVCRTGFAAPSASRCGSSRTPGALHPLDG